MLYNSKTYYQNFLEKCKVFFPQNLYYIIGNTLYVKIINSYLKIFTTFLKYHTHARFRQLVDLSCVDYPERKFRFEVFYNFLSHTYNSRIVVTSFSLEDKGFNTILFSNLENTSNNTYWSLNYLFPVAKWYEREAWDMFGVFFESHWGLRRILTDYGFKGHPLRKDFPMTGYTEIRYDDFTKRILYEEVSLTQEYRIFNLENPWS